MPAEYDTQHHRRPAYMHVRRSAEGCNVLALSVRWEMGHEWQDMQKLVG